MRPALPTRRLALAATLVYLLLRVGHLLRWDLWFDELFGVGLGYLDWGPLLTRAAADQTNPPLFYLLLKGWIAIGGSDPLWLRLLPFLAAALALWATFRLFRALALPEPVTLSALWLIAFSPLLVFYAVELRAYALLLALATAATAETATIVIQGSTSREATRRLALWNLLLVLTHYYGWFVIAAEWCAILLLSRARWRVAVFTVLPAILGFLPWVWLVANIGAHHTVAPTIAWIQRPTWVAVMNFPAFLLVGDTPLLPVAIGATVIVLLALALVLRPRASGADPQVRSERFLAIFALVPVVLAFAASWVLPRSIWGARYLIECAIPLLILISAGLARSGRKALIAGTTLLCLTAGWELWRADDTKTSWSTLARAMAPPSADSVVVYTFESYTTLPLRFYAGTTGSKLAFRMIRAPAEVQEPSGWIVGREGAWPGSEDGAASLRQWGLLVTDSATVGAHNGEVVRAWRYRR